MQHIRNIGILAHVDAGKTSITEHFLHLAGKIAQPGSVDSGTSQTDFMEVERERGISVKASGASFLYRNTKVNLIDTPGHVDFSAEVARVLPALDAAIVVLSAVEGVQSHTETIWQLLKNNGIPTLFFINKIDRVGADSQRVITEIQKDLTQNIVVLQETTRETTQQSTVTDITETNSLYTNLLESLADKDEEILDDFLEEKPVPYPKFKQHLGTAIKQADLFPVMFGSAKYGLGMEKLLETVIEYFPDPLIVEADKFSARVFKVEHIAGLGRVAHVKALSGSVKSRDTISNTGTKTEHKVTRLGSIFSGKFTDSEKINAGDIGCLCGLPDAEVGHILGFKLKTKYAENSFSVPLLSVRVLPAKDKDYAALAEALQILAIEDPALNFEWFRDEQELNIKTMGKVQLEILEHIIQQRFGVQVTFSKPTVVYKETPTTTALGTERYTMPKPCWAVLTLQVAQGKRSSGITYQSEVGVNDIARKYQNEVRDFMKTALQQGIKGWEVTDIEVTLVTGEDHEVHSRPGDFKLATAMAVLTALENSGSQLLEPILEFKITASEDLLGAVTSDITLMRGTFESPEIQENNFVLRGTVPAATSMDYAVKIASRSGGKAKLALHFKAYEPCPKGEGQSREYKGINPQDRSKYILWARRAIQ